MSAENRFVSLHDRFYVIRCRFYLGVPICEWREEFDVIETSREEEIVDLIPSLEGPIEVTFVDRRYKMASDISKDIALRVAERIRDGEFSITDDLRNFIEEHWPVGSVIPAVA